MENRRKINRTIALLVALSISGIILYHNIPMKSTNFNYASKITTFDTLEQVIAYSDKIILGTVTDVEDFNQTVSKYTLLIDKNLKSDTNEEKIEVYESQEKLLKGNSYILFLENLDHPLYSEHSYTSFEKNLILEVVENETVTKSKIFNNETDLNKIMKKINKSDYTVVEQNKDYKVINKLDSIKDLAEE
ncbi:hypothetical protein RH915_05965 [Serpentinicella sp. ANB-PHB4]|uniref:hypothetical protein n=1 Tax=Serpentinicella sp. ANB-PHB4 TaxID=3074076 RepID=UPI00285B328A|nr:hypothetical protein [Serpentinicella sp. ANB-PHB4]MDR5659029.1 hypothetical protein [Serpentinicella sp. ANB-PHB4]